MKDITITKIFSLAVLDSNFQKVMIVAHVVERVVAHL